SDTGPEYISGLLQQWANKCDIRLGYIQPGNPQQNTYAERFSRTVRYERLSQYLWQDPAEVLLSAPRSGCMTTITTVDTGPWAE
ncbi:MAG: integrase core domain-containing protein, partial [Gammaproteobacteria bacterium]|nr:integrase core domain-containing protein [Gammaproteobacteria bacterium]